MSEHNLIEINADIGDHQMVYTMMLVTLCILSDVTCATDICVRTLDKIHIAFRVKYSTGAVKTTLEISPTLNDNLKSNDEVFIHNIYNDLLRFVI